MCMADTLHDQLHINAPLLRSTLCAAMSLICAISLTSLQSDLTGVPPVGNMVCSWISGVEWVPYYMPINIWYRYCTILCAACDTLSHLLLRP